jgi:hypothetical protein
MVVHPRDADTAWMFPMDASSVWPRTARRQTGGLCDAQRRKAGSVRHRPAETRRAGRERQAMARMQETPLACTSVPPAANSGRAATKARPGPASHGICRRSTRWKRQCWRKRYLR